MAHECSKLPVLKEDQSLNGTSWEAWRALYLILGGRSVFRGPF